MSVTYALVGYDRKTERISVAHEIPDSYVGFALYIARAGASDDRAGSYPLEPGQARDIAGTLDISLDVAGLDFFLEPFSEPKRVARS
jgi:hypothetical protein